MRPVHTLPIDDLGYGSRDVQLTSAYAPSKLNCPASVPTTAPTLIAIRAAEPLYAGGAHATVVADVHAVLLHTSAVASDAVAVGLEVPKLSPLIVMVPLPLDTAFAMAVLTTGAAQPNSCSYCGVSQLSAPLSAVPYRRR
jgi:hypothetical protein